MGWKKSASCRSPSRLVGCNAPARVVTFVTTTTANAVDVNLISLPGASFLMGTQVTVGFAEDGEGPVREVEISAFSIDSVAVTNAQFAAFYEGTWYLTNAEKFGWSFVSYQLLSEGDLAAHPQRVVEAPWWWVIAGACWNHPEGPGSDHAKKIDHPVTHVSRNGAINYARWAGKRLSTEAEWEYPGCGGLEQKCFPWGDKFRPGGEHRCIIWQGHFPDWNTMEDGYLGTDPVQSFIPNGFSLDNMSGNVWVWCHGWFSVNFHRTASRLNPVSPLQGRARPMRGASFLCHRSYCNRYRVAARTKNSLDSAASNIGFRCVI